VSTAADRDHHCTITLGWSIASGVVPSGAACVLVYSAVGGCAAAAARSDSSYLHWCAAPVPPTHHPPHLVPARFAALGPCLCCCERSSQQQLCVTAVTHSWCCVLPHTAPAVYTRSVYTGTVYTGADCVSAQTPFESVPTQSEPTNAAERVTRTDVPPRSGGELHYYAEGDRLLLSRRRRRYVEVGSPRGGRSTTPWREHKQSLCLAHVAGSVRYRGLPSLAGSPRSRQRSGSTPSRLRRGSGATHTLGTLMSRERRTSLPRSEDRGDP